MRNTLAQFENKRKKFYGKVIKIIQYRRHLRILLADLRDLNLEYISDHTWINYQIPAISNDSLMHSVIAVSGIVKPYTRRDGTIDYGLNKTKITKVYYQPHEAPMDIKWAFWLTHSQNHG